MREERLRATAGLRGSLTLSSWRGRSGRRYVVGVHPLTEGSEVDATDAVLIAVRRDGDGFARIVALTDTGSWPESPAAWAAEAGRHGAIEVHVHRLAEDEGERRRIIDDLRDDEGEG